MRPEISRIALIAALGFAPGALRAEDALHLGQVVVSALKTESDSRATGMAVSVISADDVHKSFSGSFAGVLAREVGVSSLQEGPIGNRGAVRLRGLDGRYLGVYIDGINVADPTEPTGSFDFGALLTADLGRTELLRGSQSALWGGSAVAGVITIDSLAGIEEGRHQRVTAEGGSYGTARLSYGYSEKTDQLELAVNATQFHSDGFSASAGGTEADGVDITRLSLLARYNVSDDLSLGASLFQQRTESEFDPGFGQDAADYSTDRREIGLRLFSDLSLGLTQHEFEFTLFDTLRETQRRQDFSSYDGRRLGLSWQVKADLRDDLTAVGGISAQRQEADYANLQSGSATNDNYGAFAQAIWSPSEAFDMSAALRMDRDESFGNFPTGRVAVAWHATSDLTLRAALARGFRAPALDERFGDYPSEYGDFAGNPDLGPEKSWSYELGADYRWGGGVLSATLYQIEIDNLIKYKWDPVLSTLENVAGVSISKGVELAADLPVGDRVSFGVNYSYTDTRDAQGARLMRVPQHLLNMSLSAEVTDQMSMGLGVKRIAGLLDRDGEWDVVSMPDYTLWDARLEYAISDSLDAYLRLENLTNKHYAPAYGYSAPERSAYLGIVSRF